MLVGKVLRSPYPHAKILRIDTSKAENLPGVKAIITKDDVPGRTFNVTILPHYMLRPELRGDPLDQYVLNDKVRFIGDAVAAVAAINESIADKALELLDVDYEELPAVFDPEEALLSEPPAVVHPEMAEGAFTSPRFPFRFDPSMPNCFHHYNVRKGDLTKAFAEADLVVENRYSTARLAHCALVPHRFCS